jgi:hypothetical protein
VTPTPVLALPEVSATERGADPARLRTAQTAVSSNPTRLAGPETEQMHTPSSASTRILPPHDDCNLRATPIEFP